MTSIFLSSTCYDLIDLREEVDNYLRGLGLTVRRSDASDFAVKPNCNSIETCLIHVRESNYFVCVLSQRYGPSLQKAGYDDLSATHLEYREAKDLKKPILVFIRDRLQADYASWKKADKSPDFGPAWARKKDAPRLFELIDEHERLQKDAESTNWLFPFTSVLDLKSKLREQLKTPIDEAILRKLVDDERVPLIALKKTPGYGESGDKMTWAIHIQNLGQQTALDIRIKIYDLSEWLDAGSLGPHQTTKYPVALRLDHTRLTSDAQPPILCGVQFYTPSGHRLEAQFHVLPSPRFSPDKFTRHQLKLIELDTFQLCVDRGSS